MWFSKPPPGVQLNINNSLVQGLVGCWLFNEGSGLRANDLSGNKNTGVLTNFEPFSSTQKWIGTNNGTGLMFNGTNTNVFVGFSPSLNITDKITISAWINTKGSAGNQRIVLGQLVYTLFLNSSNNVSLKDGHGNGVTSTTSILNNNWYHVAGVFSGNNGNVLNSSNAFIYINGVSQPSTYTGSWGATSLANFYIGINPTLDFFNGIIREVMVWKRGLSSQEIQQIYAQPFGIFWNTSDRIRKLYSNE